ncbi:MAG: peptide chain release factor N(5)-glutamine methyltransferase [Candidatus Limisoma sp.]
MNEPITLGQMIAVVRTRLRDQYPPGEVEGFIKIIFRELLGYETVDILLHKDTELPDFIVTKTTKVVDQLRENRPIQYIFGKAWFHGHEFSVDSSTLIPRPETEELVDLIIDENRGSDLRVLDIGTGSGCIAVSLALGLRFAVVDAIDISDRALAVAQQNASQLRARVNFRRDDILTTKPVDNSYDIIVSNPPYIADSELRSMAANVVDYEPHTALFVPDSDPLRFYRAITEYACRALADGGRLYFEINSRFPDEMRTLLDEHGFVDIDIRRDMQGLYRFATATKHE